METPQIFIVRLFPGRRGFVERVRTGQKEPVDGVEDLPRAIAAILDRDDDIPLETQRG